MESHHVYRLQGFRPKELSPLLLPRNRDSVSCMTTKNPFPGMNPFFEQRWRDAHSSLITYLRDALQELLPPDLIVGAEEEVVTIGAGELATSYRPDVQVREPSALKEPGATEVELQPLIDQCHERGRYHLLNYRLGLNPPLPPEDAAWADKLLRERHLL